MKKIIILLVAILLVSCQEQINYPTYAIEKISVIPDSLAVKHREWIKETVRAASQNMTGGDYEDVDETIIQTQRTADEIFSVEVIGLRKSISENYWDDILLKPNEMNEKEVKIFNSLKCQ